MKKEENGKVANADGERRKKLISAVFMAFACILMMSGATYAWFTMSNTAKVTSLKLNVAAEGKLYVYTDNTVATKKVSEVEWPDMSQAKTLYPCTTTDGTNMLKPVYGAENEVTGTQMISDATEKKLYCLEQDFYLYMDEGTVPTPRTYNVSLVQNNANNDGTYFKCSESAPNPAYCVRMSFEVNGQSVAVYEPNYNGSNGGTEGTDYAKNSSGVTPVASTHKQGTDGLFTSTSTANKAPVTGDSDMLFTITGNTATKVTVRAWFEGTDSDCRNEIDVKDIAGQIKFVANKAATTNP